MEKALGNEVVDSSPSKCLATFGTEHSSFRPCRPSVMVNWLTKPNTFSKATLM